MAMMANHMADML